MRQLTRAILTPVLALAASCAIGSFVTRNGTSYEGNVQWLTLDEAEREEQEAAEIIQEHLGIPVEESLKKIKGVNGHGIDKEWFACGAVPFACGCNRDGFVRIAEKYGACGHTYAAWRHEVAHSMLNTPEFMGDGGHLLSVWPDLDKQSQWCPR